MNVIWRCLSRAAQHRAALLAAGFVICLSGVVAQPLSGQPQYQLTIEPMLGSLPPRTILPVRLNVQRLGPSAVLRREERLYFYEQAEGYPGSMRQVVGQVLTIQPGSTAVTADCGIGMVGTHPYSVHVCLERDGDLRFSHSRGDLLQEWGYSVPNLFLQVAYTDWRFLFVEPQPVSPVQSTRIRQATPQAGSMASNAMSFASAVATASDPPAVWWLQAVIGELPASARQSWGLAAPAAAPLGMPVVPDDQVGAAEHALVFSQHSLIADTTADRLPERWDWLMPADFVFMGCDALEKLRQERPAAWRAVRDWVAAGGRLVLTGAGERLEGLAAFEPVWFELPAGEVRNFWRIIPARQIADGLRNSPGESGWSLPAVFRGPQPASAAGLPIDEALPIDESAEPVVSVSSIENTLAIWPDQSRPWTGDAPPAVGEVVVANFGEGRIVAMPGSAADWRKSDWMDVLVAAVACNSGKTMAQGLVGISGDQLGQLTLPKLGKPPWVAFLAVSLVFAALAGPLSYRWLSRRGRLPWLLGIVPALALLATTGLVVFALVSEGFGVRSARISLTRLDQRAHRALVQTVLVGYSGISPGRYIFPDDRPVIWNRGESYDSLELHDGRSVAFSGGILRSRTVHQIAMTTPVVSDAALQVVPPAGDRGQWQVTNRLGLEAGLAIIRTESEWIILADLPPGATVNADGLSRLDAEKKLALLCQSGASAIPHARAFAGAIVFEPRWSSWNSYRRRYYDPGREHRFRPVEAVQLLKKIGAVGDLETEIPPGGWLVISRENPLAGSLPIASQTIDEVHLIHGRW